MKNDEIKNLDSKLAAPYVLKHGDILFARSGATVGKTFMYREEDGEACFAGYLIRARVSASIASHDYIALVVRSSYYWSFIKSTAIQATIENVAADKYSSLPVVIPPLDEQAAIYSFLKTKITKFDSLILAAEKAIDLLRERRSAVISAAVTGQIDVRGAA